MRLTILIIIVIVVLFGGFLLFRNRSNVTNTNVTNTSTTTNTEVSNATSTDTTNKITKDIIVSSPKSGDSISSPITVTVSALGSWYFEATAPVKITDLYGKV